MREKRLFLVKVGKVEDEIVKHLLFSLPHHISLEFKEGGSLPEPTYAFWKERNQYHSPSILLKLKGVKDKLGGKVLGLVNLDLFTPGLNFIFGEAELGGEVALVALLRLREEFYAHPPSPRLFLLRTLKEAVHEIGHLFSLPHCPLPTCVMHFSNSLRDTDRKNPDFCSLCRKRLPPFSRI